MTDRLRNEVKDSSVGTKGAGIDINMITDDYLNTAVAIDQGLEDTFNVDIEQYRVCAGVAPKVKIVKAIQSHNIVVCMTVDSVNDAPSLKAADIGVAIGITATDVPKQSSQVLIPDDNFAIIVDATEDVPIV
uniref:Calcium-transporting ATPase n=1 Tax=Eufriesea mexicana TaxID=516756 RepID=A0A310SCV6_9HYME